MLRKIGEISDNLLGGIVGRINYLLIDETDQADDLECEGEILERYFSSSRRVNDKRSVSHIHRKSDYLSKLKKGRANKFNIVHLAAHGEYQKKQKDRLDRSAVYRKRDWVGKEVFCPDAIVRTELCADVFVSTCCQTFNDHFLEVLKGYGKVRNYIAPVKGPFPGETIVFSLLFYNDLINRLAWHNGRIPDDGVISSFRLAQKAFKTYGGAGRFRLYNQKGNLIV
jgi:hypothetical protein